MSDTRQIAVNTFQANLSKHFKIWFSKDRETFLGFENQMRLKNMREKSPHIQITLIYSEMCLNQDAIQRLHIFCAANKIVPVNFDSLDTQDLSDREKRLYARGKEEIQKTITCQGGNMAAASDCVRCIVPVIEKYGIYSDCDVQVELPLQDNFLVDIQAPVVFPVSFNAMDDSQYYANDILIVAHDPKTPNKIADTARERMAAFQQSILDSYANYFDIIFDHFTGTRDINVTVLLLVFLRSLFHETNKPNDVYAFRKYLETLSFDHFQKSFTNKHWLEFFEEEWLDGTDVQKKIGMDVLQANWENVTQKIVIDSVSLISGPRNTENLLLDRSNFAAQLQSIRDSSLKNNGTLGHYFTREHIVTRSRVPVCDMADSTFKFQDMSWTPKGVVAQAEREKKAAATAIANAWRTHRLFKMANGDSVVLESIKKDGLQHKKRV